MGEHAEDMLDGLCCSLCGAFFIKDGELYEHGYPVVCIPCYRSLPRREREEHQCADEATE